MTNNDILRTKDMEVIRAFTYNKDSILSVHIYDKKLKIVFAGYIYPSSWTRKEILKPKEKIKQ